MCVRFAFFLGRSSSFFVVVARVRSEYRLPYSSVRALFLLGVSGGCGVGGGVGSDGGGRGDGVPVLDGVYFLIIWLTWLFNSSILDDDDDGVIADRRAMLDRGGVSGLVAVAGVRGGGVAAALTPPLRRCCCRLSNFFCKCSLRYVFPMSLMLKPFFFNAFMTAAVPCGVLLKSE